MMLISTNLNSSTMTRFEVQKKALELRKQGMSYSQIKKILMVSKSTLSSWLKNYPLSKERITELRDKNEIRIERFRETMRNKKEARLKNIYDQQKFLLLPFSKREIFIAGLFLYWGEGSKHRLSSLAISNTDHAVIKFFIQWLNLCFAIPKNIIKIDLHLYGDMDVKKEITYWSKKLNISTSQFSHPYIKKTSSTDINHKGSFGHGTCNARIGNARLSEKVLMGIKTIADQYS